MDRVGDADVLGTAERQRRRARAARATTQSIRIPQISAAPITGSAMRNRKAAAHGKGCYCVACERGREITRKNARAADEVGINLVGKKADRPLRSCNDCKTPVYQGKAAPNRPDLPIWAWQYNPEIVDWGIEYATEGGAPSLCPRCRRKEQTREVLP